MMSRYFHLRSELSGAIAKRLRHAKNQLSVPGSFFNQFVTDIYIYIYIYIYICTQARFACMRCTAGGHFVSAIYLKCPPEAQFGRLGSH